MERSGTGKRGGRSKMTSAGLLMAREGEEKRRDELSETED